jgi:hypothetical protein|uniref:Uncharacterized protein n=1 Tax=Sipha flava TaxID=143950 RepID=A0A2S2PY18_9HEMI
MKQQYDKGHYEGVKFIPGEVEVMKRQPRLGKPFKLQAKYRVRPMQVIQVLPSDTYRVADVASDGRQLYSTTAHVSQLKSWKVIQEDEDEEVEDQKDKTERPVLADSTTPETTNAHPVRRRRLPVYLKDYDIADRGRFGNSEEAEC